MAENQQQYAPKSGSWRGSYDQAGQEHSFKVYITFGGHTFTGTGDDEIGKFTIKGTWENTGDIKFKKAYNKGHDVSYKGKLSEDGERIEGKYWGEEAFRMSFYKRVPPKSGKWKGSYDQKDARHPFNIDINFEGLTLTGTGEDTIGKFTIDGTWEKNGIVQFTKTYKGAHNVSYEGQFSEDGEHMEGLYWGKGPFRMSYTSSA